MKHQFARVVCACACLLVSSGALLAQPAPQAVQPANQAEEKDDPSRGSTDIDRTVAYPMAQVLVAARQALANYRCNLKKETPDYLEYTRDRNIGGGSGGGEKVTVQLSANDSETRVEIKTGKEFWFQIPLGQKNWSAPIFEAMVTALEQPLDPASGARVREQLLEPAQGARVRVTAPGAARPRLTGNILTADEKTLTIIDQAGQRVQVPRELVTGLDVSVAEKAIFCMGFSSVQWAEASMERYGLYAVKKSDQAAVTGGKSPKSPEEPSHSVCWEHFLATS